MTLINLKDRIAVSHKVSVPNNVRNGSAARVTLCKSFLGQQVQETETFEQWRILEVTDGSYLSNGITCALQYDADRKLNVVVDIRKDWIVASQAVEAEYRDR